MDLPSFYVETLKENRIVLDEDTSKHMTGVLRMKKNEQILLTDGKGKRTYAVIVDDNRKKSVVEISDIEFIEKRKQVAIGISLIKNSSRFEWFLEKATEIGVSEIIPLICARTEKEKFRFERMQQILISAMLQSKQSWLPVLNEPIEFSRFLQSEKTVPFSQKFIAHCQEGKQALTNQLINLSPYQLILIGPEGDFTLDEIELAIQNKFLPLSLGPTRLRTETAGIVAATLFLVTIH